MMIQHLSMEDVAFLVIGMSKVVFQVHFRDSQNCSFYVTKMID